MSPLQGLEILPRAVGGLAGEGLCWVASQASGPIPLGGLPRWCDISLRTMLRPRECGLTVARK